MAKDLGQLLNKLYSNEARAKLIFLAMDNYTIPEEYIEKAIKWYERTGKIDNAIAVATKAQNKEKVVEIYEHAGHFEAAAEAAQQVNLTAKAEALFKKALETYTQGRNFEAAAKLATKQGQQEQANEFYRRAVEEYSNKELYGVAAEIAEKKGMIEWAQSLYEKALGNKKEGIYGWIKNNMKIDTALDENVIKELEKAGRYEEAAEVAKHFQMPEKAIMLFEKVGKYAEAAEVAEETAFAKKKPIKKTTNKLEMLLEKIKNSNKSRTKFLEKAIENYEKARWCDSAVAVAQRAGLTETAIQIYERAGRFDDAANIAKKAGAIKRALDIYEKAGDYSNAAKVAEKAGLFKRKVFYEALEKKIITSRKNEKESTLGMLLGISAQGKDNYEKIAPEKHIFALYRRINTAVEGFIYDLGLSFAKKAIFRGIKYGIPALLGTGVCGTGVSVTLLGEKDVVWDEVTCALTPKYFIQGKFCRTYQWDAYLSFAERKNKIPEGLLAGIAMVESSGDPTALNKRDNGSAGFFQIPQTIAFLYGLPFFEAEQRGEKYYGKKLRIFAQSMDYNREQLERIDGRFDVGLSAYIFASYLKNTYNKVKEQQEKDPKLANDDPWDVTIGIYLYFSNPLEKSLTRNNDINNVKEYQQYYLKKKQEKQQLERHAPK